MKTSPSIPALLFMALFALCHTSSLLAAPRVVPKAEAFGKTKDGTAVEAYTLSNQRGMKLRAMTYGAIVLSLETPDRAGKPADVVLGFQTLAEYVKDTPYFGAIVGRFGNRIANGKFTLGGKTYTLAANNAPADMPCSLHGGLRGFDKVIWRGEGLAREGAQGVRFRYTSKDGEEGYPGNLELSVTYWLTESSEWQVEFEATTDKATPVNVTQHSYFNLKGEGSGDILDHELQIAASKFTPVNAGMIPTGQILPVAGTPLDFTKATAIGARIEADHKQLKFGGGYDHNWVLDNQNGKLSHAATAYEPASGRQLEVLTTEPGIQFYCGNFLDGSLRGKAGALYQKRNGFCLETQHYPDAPNHPDFPSCILLPGKTLRSATVFRFSTR